MSETMVKERRDTLPSGPVKESAMPPYRYQDPRVGGGGSLSTGDQKSATPKDLKGVNLAI